MTPVSIAAARRPSAPAAPVSVRRHPRPRPAVELSRLTRYHGGTYSHTVDRIVFTDATVARTDLIRLNPGVEAYSLDFSGIAPLRPSHYDVESFAALPNTRARAFEVEIDWILRNSFPTLRAAELSRRLRDAGYLAGAAHIAEHEAIAATQAAIWHFTNGLELDTRRLDEPDRLVRHGSNVTAEFHDAPELDGYTVDVEAAEPVRVSLQKSSDGHDWREVAASTMSVGTGRHHRVLGLGATVSRGHGHTRAGHRYYRVSVHGAGIVHGIRFSLSGSRTYRNAPRIVHAYRYLIEGARAARAAAVAPVLELTAESGRDLDSGLIGPFRFRAGTAGVLGAEGADVVDRQGDVLTGPLDPGTEFFVRAHAPARGARGLTVTVTVPGRSDGHGGRVLTGVAREQESQRFTPVALVVPIQSVVEFDITW